MWEEEKQAAQMVSYLNQSRFLKQKEARVWPGSLSTPLDGRCLFQRAILEVDASLKWMPWQSKLISGTYIIKKRKSSCQGLHCKWLATSNFDVR